MNGTTDTAVTPHDVPSRQPAAARGTADGAASAEDTPLDDPAEFVRIATMLARLSEELEHIDLDEQGLDRLQRLHDDARDQVGDNLGAALAAEMERLVPKLGDTDRTEAEVRVAHLQLTGWLQGVAQGVQLMAMSRQMRQQPPQGGSDPMVAGELPGGAVPDSSGTYL